MEDGSDPLKEIPAYDLVAQFSGRQIDSVEVEKTANSEVGCGQDALNVAEKQPRRCLGGKEEKFSETEERRWEDLEMDCLVSVLGRIGMESLLLDVPLVCKSWHKASLDPLCWKQLVFPPFSYLKWFNRLVFNHKSERYGINELSYPAFMKFIIDRSCGNAATLVLPVHCTEEELKYAANVCPALKYLGLPHDIQVEKSILLEVIRKWKILEGLFLQTSNILNEILIPISLHCKNFIGLWVTGAYIRKEEASAIVTLIPKIKHLHLRKAFIDREHLVTILQGCKELVTLDVSNCVGFEVDDKILKLASHIGTFKYEGSSVYRCNVDMEYLYSLQCFQC